MTDLDQRVRERLRTDAERFLSTRRPTNEMPAKTARRTRVRQGITLVSITAVIVAGAIGAFAAGSAIVGSLREGEPAASGTELVRVRGLDEAPLIHSEDWRGIWLEVTEPAARSHALDAETPGSAIAWRFSPGVTATRYLRGLGWTDFETTVDQADDALAYVRANGPAHAQDAVAEVVLERLPVLGHPSIWFVTGLSVQPTTDGDALAARAVEELVRSRATALTSLFLQYRNAGDELAELFLAPAAAETYRSHRDDLYLYGHVSGDPQSPGHPDGHPTLVYGGFDIRTWPAFQPDGSLVVFVDFNVAPFDAQGDTQQDLPEYLRIEARDGRLQIVDAARTREGLA